ncbi:unnamed protein product [Notodromas monacha]|uniref:Uncharacterized protein n=1 Tax=Notodromas monacha TaxID=399045 RepID=A0A7R9BWL1_9CRUS|nr:unnamed protein product [Notodromas monacha]CAG0923112.1 unnamed protein product [Notodromas monacha]
MEEGGTPFLDQLRNDSLAIYWTDRGYKDDAHSEKTFNSRDGRESVATVVTNSSSNSSSDTLKCHGSLGDLSNYGHLNNNNNGGNNNQLIMNSPGSPTHVKYDVAHSAKVPPVERHNSECVLYYGISPVKKQVEKSPNIDTTKPPSVAERIHELERQSRSVPDLLKSSGLSELRPRPPAPATPASNASTPIRTPSKSGQILDAEKNRNELKALQKQAVMEFFERQTGKIRSPGYGTVSRSAVVNGTLPRTRPNNAVKTLQVN